MNQDLLQRELPKWPALLVSGKRVTREQAAVIIVRTDSLWFSCNDRDLEAKLRATIGFRSEKANGEDWRAVTDHDNAVKATYGNLGLRYLNNSRIVSSYVFGPHGWCDWSGNIFCNSYNIGKWPRVKEVLEDWKKIAEAFPFLDLRSQLMSAESCEDNGVPVVEFVVKDGKVELVEPQGQLLPVVSPDFNPAMLMGPVALRESGCTIPQFVRALELTKESLASNVSE
jgi:hypothetical protein